MSISIAIIAASLESNALGRATTLYDMLPEATNRLGIWGPPARAVWQNYDKQYDIFPLDRPSTTRLVQSLNRSSAPVVWVSKGFPSSSSLLRLLPPNVTVLADFDDDDIALAEEFRNQSLTNRVKLHRFRPGSPERLTRSQRFVQDRASLTTSSSEFLAKKLGLPPTTLRVPHGRSSAHELGSEVSDFRRLGFLGTMRPHKGYTEIVTALRGDERLSITTFAQRGLNVPTDLLARWHMIPSNSTIESAYATIDVSVLPLDLTSPGALAQLPAKAIDAASMGTPIASSPTPVMREYFGRASLEITDWATLGSQLERAFISGDLQRVATAAHALWTAEFDAERLGAEIYARIKQLLPADSC